jgi:hypothetical protein
LNVQKVFDIVSKFNMVAPDPSKSGAATASASRQPITQTNDGATAKNIDAPTAKPI